jgi:hypothetical protein
MVHEKWYLSMEITSVYKNVCSPQNLFRVIHNTAGSPGVKYKHSVFHIIFNKIRHFSSLNTCPI